MNFESNFIMFLCDVDMVFDADIERFEMSFSTEQQNGHVESHFRNEIRLYLYSVFLFIINILNRISP